MVLQHFVRIQKAASLTRLSFRGPWVEVIKIPRSLAGKRSGAGGIGIFTVQSVSTYVALAAEQVLAVRTIINLGIDSCWIDVVQFSGVVVPQRPASGTASLPRVRLPRYLLRYIATWCQKATTWR